MKLTKRRRDSRPQMDMTPMIDIVFLLIIFFMTVTQVSKLNKEQVDLPKLQGSEDQKPSVLTINVTADEKIVISGRSLSVDDLIAMLNRELRRVGDNPQMLSIVIRADRRGRSGGVSGVVRALKRLNILQVRIAVEVPQ